MLPGERRIASLGSVAWYYRTGVEAENFYSRGGGMCCQWGFVAAGELSQCSDPDADTRRSSPPKDEAEAKTVMRLMTEGAD